MAMLDQRYQHVTNQYNAEHVTTIQGISEERYERLAEELGVARSALTSFFKILEQRQVPPEDLDHTLRQIATSYKELHARLQRFTSDDPAVVALKQQAREAVEAGEFARAEALLNGAAAKDIEAATHLQETAATRLVSAAASVADLGELKMTQLAYAAAMGYFQHAAGLIEALPTAPQDTLAEYLAAWGRAAYEAGAYGAAERPYQRALAIREEALGPLHPDVASSLNNLAELYRMQGQYTQAAPLYQRALAVCQDPSEPQDPLVLPTILNNLALLYESQGRHAEAEPLYQQALTIWEHTPERSSLHLAATLDNLAELRRAQGRYAEAEPLYERSLAIFTQKLPPTHPDVATGLNNLAQLYQAQGRYVEAEQLHQQALDIREAGLGRTHPDVAHSLNNLAQLYTNQGPLNFSQFVEGRSGQNR